MENAEFNSMVAFQRSMLGAFGESVVAARFYREDVPVFRPIHDNQRGYDLIVDIDGHLLRVQVKVMSTQGQAALGTVKRRWGKWDEMPYATTSYTPNSFDVLACVDRKNLNVYCYTVDEIDFNAISFRVEESEGRDVHNLTLKLRTSLKSEKGED